jgi:hypothetical protein
VIKKVIKGFIQPAPGLQNIADHWSQKIFGVGGKKWRVKSLKGRKVKKGINTYQIRVTDVLPSIHNSLENTAKHFHEEI